MPSACTGIRLEDVMLDADAFHSKHAVRGPRYLEFAVRFMGDDCVAINGDHYLVTESEAGSVRVLAKEAMRIRAGGKVEVTTGAGRHETAPRVARVVPAGRITAAEQDYVRGLVIDDRMEKTVFRRLTTPPGDCRGPPAATPRGRPPPGGWQTWP